MINFLFTTFFGVIFVFAMAFIIVGSMFVLRGAGIFWFDYDWYEAFRKWINKWKKEDAKK